MLHPDEVAAVRSREDLAKFVLALCQDLKKNPGTWENRTLEEYLEALSGWIGDMDGFYRNRGETPPVLPGWSTVARMLDAAAIYE